jgi:xanthine dehydrogenase accessory factor
MTPASDHSAAGADHVHDAACAAAHGESAPPGQRRRLVLVFRAPVAREIAALAARLGWPVTVIDPDARLADEPWPSAERLAGVAAARLDTDCDVVVCDHDRPELGPLLAEVLAHPVGWVGVMGSRRHTAPHVAALQELGVPAEQIARVHRPIGLDIGSTTPPEIAVATVAGLIADRTGRPGGFFSS